MRQFIPIERRRTNEADEEQRNSLTAAHFANYQESNKTLRTWFVTFGIGALTLFILHPEVVKPLKAVGSFGPIIKLYLAGCGAQIAVALINKFGGWHAYNAARDSDLESNWWYQFWAWLFSQFWLDMLADCLSLVTFGAATYLIFISLV